MHKQTEKHRKTVPVTAHEQDKQCLNPHPSLNGWMFMAAIKQPPEAKIPADVSRVPLFLSVMKVGPSVNEKTLAVYLI